MASLSPEASGEDEWYFVHCMDDGDIEELEMYEINNGIELFNKLVEHGSDKSATMVFNHKFLKWHKICPG